jgi:predicted nucleotidyltransferase
MSLFQQLSEEAQRRQLPFLVIGGLAVNFHGVPRDTADLDLLIRKDAREPWLAFFSELGYTIYQDKQVFVQLSPPKAGAWPVDLMLVGEPTFRQMIERSLEVEMYGTHVRIPVIEHLIALKLHALKHGHVGRFMKDFLDVENLVRAHHLDLHADPIRRLFLKYGNPELYERISHACAGE